MRALLAGTGSLVLLGGFLLFNGDASTQTNTASDQFAAPDSDQRAIKTAPDNNRLWSLEEENRRLQAQVELQEFMLKSQVEDQVEQEEEMAQQLMPWPEDLPEKYMPKGYQKKVHEILDACWPDAEWLGMDCKEPPCIAAVRIDSVEGYSKHILNCPQWQEAYGFPDISAKGYDCPDGSSGYISMLLPAMSHLVDDPFDTTRNENCRTREVREDGTVIIRLEQTPDCDAHQIPRIGRRKNAAYRVGPDGGSGFAYGKACGFY